MIPHITDRDNATLQELAQQTGKTQEELMSIAIQALKRKFMLESINNGYRELQGDPEAWSEECAQRNVWEVALVTDVDRQQWS